jgi:hypothetical protein
MYKKYESLSSYFFSFGRRRAKERRRRGENDLSMRGDSEEILPSCGNLDCSASNVLSNLNVYIAKMTLCMRVLAIPQVPKE